jgi:hypothetical protein
MTGRLLDYLDGAGDAGDSAADIRNAARSCATCGEAGDDGPRLIRRSKTVTGTDAAKPVPAPTANRVP